MGFVADTFHSLLRTDQKALAVASTVTPYEVSGYASQRQTGPGVYARYAQDGYIADELVYQCIDIRANAAGEPGVVAWQDTASGEEKVEKHPSLDLLEHPNAFMSRSRFWQTLLMHLDINGNAYVEKVRSGAGKIVELWLLRPDRVHVLPDQARYIRGYTYEIGGQKFTLDAADVIHFKTRHPLDDFYGLPPLAVLAGRVDLDVWTRKFTEAFFRNAGVPAGLLNIQKQMTPQEREDTRRRFRELYGGEQGWHKLLVLDTGPNQSATYTPMGLPLGSNGAAMPELNEINEARILGVYGIPLSLIPTLAGSRANRGQTASEAEFAAFWKLTMVPLFRDLDSTLSMGLHDDFPELNRFEHDLQKVQALQENEDAKHTRVREDWKAGLVTWAEARTAVGEPEEPDEEGVVMLLNTSVPTPSNALVDPEDAMLEANQQTQPQQPAPDQAQQPAQPVANGRTNGVAH